METFVKLNRRFMEWRWYHDPAMTHLFTHLIMRANYSDADWQETTVRRGQLVTSRHALAMETGLTEKVVRRCLHQLAKTGEIRTESTHHYSLITVIKYAEYQGDGAPMGQQKTSEGPAVGQQRATIEEEKKERKEENALPCPAPSKESLTVADTEMDSRQFMDLFNHAMQGKRIAQIEGIDAKRQELLNACLKEFGKDALFTVIHKAAASSFLNDGARISFLASYDWIFKPSNFRKILEGNYDDNVKPNKNNHGADNISGYRSADDIVSGAAGIILGLRSGSNQAQEELPVV